MVPQTPLMTAQVLGEETDTWMDVQVRNIRRVRPCVQRGQKVKALRVIRAQKSENMKREENFLVNGEGHAKSKIGVTSGSTKWTFVQQKILKKTFV